MKFFKVLKVRWIMKKNSLLTLGLGLCLVAGQLSAQNQGLMDKQTDNSLSVSNLKDLSNNFAKHFPGPYVLEKDNLETIGKNKVPHLRSSSDEILNNNQKVIAFAARNNANVSIYAKVGDEFVRISTSFKRRDGSTARGTALDHESPAYQNLSKDMGFTGKMMVHGKEYLVKYDPIKDKRGNIVGAFLVAVPSSNAVN